MKNNGGSRKGADRVQGAEQKHPGGAFPVQVPHLLYRDWKSLKPDGRSWFAKEVKRIVGRLLEPFKGSIPPAAQILAEITAKNLMVALRVEGLFFKGADLARNTLRDYVGLVNSNSANLARLFEMSKHEKPDDRVPTLEEYLKRAAKAQPVPAVITVGKDKAVAASANESAAPQPAGGPGEGAAFDWGFVEEEHEHHNL